MVLCRMCKMVIPVYEGRVYNGFVKPAAKGSDAEKASVEFTQGPLGMTATGVEIPVCAGCYLEEFARQYPGAELPTMPALVD